MVPVYKKLVPCDKANFRSVSVLPLLSKVFEKVVCDQIYEAHSTQHALFRLLQKWQAQLDSVGYVGIIFVDLSKAYECLSHDLLNAKLETYGLDIGRLNFLLD